MDSLTSELISIENRGLQRSLPIKSGLDFSSNDYLGYSQNLEIKSKLLHFMSQHSQLGSTGSRLISGNTKHTEEIETFLAQQFQTQDCLIFGSGYLANLGVCSALGGADTEFFSDELNHASLIDGVRLAKSKYQVFRHCDLNHLENLLQTSSQKRKVILTESIFSMDGDHAPLQEILAIADRHNAFVVVDEAHSTGTCGQHGRGSLSEIKFNAEKIIAVHTAGKALGAYGAFVCGSHHLIQLLLNKSRSFIFTTALPPLMIEHIRLALMQLTSDQESQQKLKSNIRQSKLFFDQHQIKHSGSHILPVILGSNDLVLKAEKHLAQNGFFVKAIRSPTVAKGSERLRITLKSNHDAKSLERISEHIAEITSEFIY